MKRRTFLRTTLAVGTTLSIGGSQVLGANDAVRLGASGIALADLHTAHRGGFARMMGEIS